MNFTDPARSKRHAATLKRLGLDPSIKQAAVPADAQKAELVRPSETSEPKPRPTADFRPNDLDSGHLLVDPRADLRSIDDWRRAMDPGVVIDDGSAKPGDQIASIDDFRRIGDQLTGGTMTDQDAAKLTGNDWKILKGLLPAEDQPQVDLLIAQADAGQDVAAGLGDDTGDPDATLADAFGTTDGATAAETPALPALADQSDIAASQLQSAEASTTPPDTGAAPSAGSGGFGAIGAIGNAIAGAALGQVAPDSPEVDQPEPEVDEPTTPQPGEGDPGQQQAEQAEPSEEELRPFMPQLVNQPGPEDDATYKKLLEVVEKLLEVVEKIARRAYDEEQEDLAKAAELDPPITAEQVDEVMPPGIKSPPVAQSSADAIGWHKRWDYARERAIRTEVGKLEEDKQRANDAEGFDWDDVAAILPSTNFPIQDPASINRWYRLQDLARNKAIDHLQRVEQHKQTVIDAGFNEADLERVMLDIPPAGDISSPHNLNQYYRLREARRGLALRALKNEVAAKEFCEANGLDWATAQANLPNVTPPNAITSPENIGTHYANVGAAITTTINNMMEAGGGRQRLTLPYFDVDTRRR